MSDGHTIYWEEGGGAPFFFHSITWLRTVFLPGSAGSFFKVLHGGCARAPNAPLAVASYPQRPSPPSPLAPPGAPLRLARMPTPPPPYPSGSPSRALRGAHFAPPHIAASPLDIPMPVASHLSPLRTSYANCLGLPMIDSTHALYRDRVYIIPSLCERWREAWAPSPTLSP